MLKFLIPIFLLLATHCTVTHKSKTDKSCLDKNTMLDKVAASYFGDHYAINENEPGDYVLVFKKHKKLKDLIANVRFFIFSKESNSIIFEDELKAGTIIWDGDYEILATSRNQKVAKEGNQTIIYRYHVQTSKKEYRQD